MKWIADILSGFLALLVIQVILNARFPDTCDHHRDRSEIARERNMTGQLWMENLPDDNPVEARNQITPTFTAALSDGCPVKEVTSKPLQQFLLNPLFVDRPPPSICM